MDSNTCAGSCQRSEASYRGVIDHHGDVVIQQSAEDCIFTSKRGIFAHERDVSDAFSM